MLEATSTPKSRRERLHRALASGELLRFPGAISALSARLIEEVGFEGVYLSGAVISAELGLPDIGLTSQAEVVGRAAETARATDLPVLVDADTGFGEPVNVARTVQLLEDAGVAGCHIEDQVNPKRCGHLDHKEVVEPVEMARRIQAAVGTDGTPTSSSALEPMPAPSRASKAPSSEPDATSMPVPTWSFLKRSPTPGSSSTSGGRSMSRFSPT